MSQPESEASEAEQGEPESDSVYDFLYHDARRVGSFLAQFDEAGHLQQVTQSEGAMRGSKRGWKAAAGGSLPGVGGLNVSAERGPEKGGFEGSERVYDPLWANARTLLDFLYERDMVRRELEGARIGQFVLASGPLTVMDLTLWQGLWSLPALREALSESVTEQQQETARGGQTPPQNRAERRRGRASTAAQTPAKSTMEHQLEGGLALIGMLPHTIQARLRDDSGAAVWCSLREDGLVVSASDLTLKHGVTVSGRWNMLGVLDAMPEIDAAGEVTPSGIEAAQDLISFGASPFGDLMLHLTPAIRGLLGRPANAYGMTPLLIFREIAT